MLPGRRCQEGSAGRRNFVERTGKDGCASDQVGAVLFLCDGVLIVLLETGAVNLADKPLIVIFGY